MITLIRLLILLLSRRWGLIVIGGLLILSGLIVGVTSHQVSYQMVNKGKIIHYLQDDSHNVNLELQDGSLHFLNENDFSPPLNTGTMQSQIVSLVYDPTDTQSIDESSTNTNAHLSGTGSKVVELISFDGNGLSPQTFTTQEYSQNPNGFYQNNWPQGIGLLLAGLLISGIAFLLPRFSRKKNKGAFGAASPMTGIPPMGGQYPPANSYQPPYPGPAQQYPTANGQPYPGPSYPMPPTPVYPPQPGSYEATQYGSPYEVPPPQV